MNIDLNSILKTYDCSLFYKFVNFKGSHPLLIEEAHPNSKDGATKININGAEWQTTIKAEIINESSIDLNFTFSLLKGTCVQASIGVGFRFKNWSKNNYVLMPAAAYNGNRFESRKIEYPPILTDFKDLGTQKGFWMLTTQGTTLGDSGIEVEENADRSEATITLSAPGVRYDRRYNMCDTNYPCDDRGADFKEGDSIELNLRIYLFDCPTIQGLFDYFVDPAGAKYQICSRIQRYQAYMFRLTLVLYVL